MDEASIIQYITSTFDAIETITSNGNSFIFYGLDHKMPLATIVTTDEYDGFSDLDRPSVFCLNIGISKSTYRSLFVPEATHPDAASDGEGGHDFTALDHVMPHPIYGLTASACSTSAPRHSKRTCGPSLLRPLHWSSEGTTGARRVARTRPPAPVNTAPPYINGMLHVHPSGRIDNRALLSDQDVPVVV